MQLNLGDYVEVFYHRVRGGQLMLCEVLSKEAGSEDVALVLRTVAPLGFYEPWDFPLVHTEPERFYEPWEA